jgi:hypothetical protein
LCNSSGGLVLAVYAAKVASVISCEVWGCLHTQLQVPFLRALL